MTPPEMMKIPPPFITTTLLLPLLVLYLLDHPTQPTLLRPLRHHHQFAQSLRSSPPNPKSRLPIFSLPRFLIWVSSIDASLSGILGFLSVFDQLKAIFVV